MADLAALYRRKGWRRDQLANTVLEAWRPPGRMTYRNLSNQIAHLEKGKTRWWERRPDAARALAEILEVDVAELGLIPGSAPVNVLVPFRHFPAVRPFDPRTEQPCPIGNEGWFDPSLSNEAQGVAWIEAPAGTGWTLFREIYRQRHGIPVQVVGTLSEVADRDASDWLVVQVQTPDDETDVQHEARLFSRGKVIVYARFAPWGYRHNLIYDGAGAGMEPDTEATRRAVRWPRASWQPSRDWRPRFVRWLAERVAGGPSFRVEWLIQWLAEADDDHSLFATPADLLTLAGFAHEVGSKSWMEAAREKLPARWLETRITAKPGDAVESWLAGATREAVVEAVRRWVESPMPWLMAQPRASWMAWLPRAAGGLQAHELKKQVAAMEGVRLTRKHVERLAAALVPDAEGVFRKLEADAVLVMEGPDAWRFHPSWVAAWLGRQRVRALVQTSTATSWGRLAISPDRQVMVDEALDGLERLDHVLEAALREFSPAELASIAAVESLFLAVGRRLGRGHSFDAAVLARLWDCTRVGLVQRIYQGPPALLTRPGAGEGDEGRKWLEACWEWSVAVPPLRGVPDDAHWLFPGWFNVVEDGVPWWLGAGFPSRRLLSIAERLFADRPPERLAGKAPSWIEIPVLMARLAKGSEVGEAEADAVFQRTDALEYAMARAVDLDAAARSRLAKVLWRICTRPGHTDWYRNEASVRAFIDANVTDADFAALLLDGKVTHSTLPNLPARRQRALVQFWVERKSPELRWILDQEGEIAPEAIELLVGHVEREWEVARWLWPRDPPRALRCAERALLERRTQAADWFFEGMPHQPLPLLALLEGAPQRPEWAARWLARLLLERPAEAERIHAFRRSILQ